MGVPFVDLKAQHDSIKDEIQEAIAKVFEASAFSSGVFVEKFEEEFANFCNTKYAVGVSSGTDALWLSLLALNVGEDDRVITVPNSFVATAEAITLSGAEPVFVDVDSQTQTMDPGRVEWLIEHQYPKVAAIIPVHLSGHPADMDPILEIAERNSIPVIEDACQAHGAEYKGKRVGSIGQVGCFSFYPSKNLGACGEAGMIVTNDKDVAKWAKMLCDHGQKLKHCHEIVGRNARMDGLQAAILSVKLRHLPEWNEARRRSATLYNDLLSELDWVKTPVEASYARHVYHLYVVRVRCPMRYTLTTYLSANNIGFGIHYPTPIHKQHAFYQPLEYSDEPKVKCPVAERLAEEVLSLPMFPELTEEQIRYVVEKIEEVME